jgi:signal transduction histidine kinase/CheY-like chemotaxis protein
MTVGTPIVVDPHSGAADLAALIQEAGLAPLPAVRLAVAAVEVIGAGRGATVEVVAEPDRTNLVVRGGAGDPTVLPAGLVDECQRRGSAAGGVEYVLSVAADAADRELVELRDTAAQGFDQRRLLGVALATVERLAARLRASQGETAALRTELDETSRGLLAVYAELSEKGEQLEHARAGAEQASHAKAAFLANMSHEIRSPLNAVIGFAGLLIDTRLDPEQAEYAEMIRSAGDHLRGVIDDILDLSKIESGRLELEHIPFDLVACVEDAVAVVAARAEEKNLALGTLFAPDTPAAIVGDPVRIRQILVNLLSNAVKFTAGGEVVVEVTSSPVGSDRCCIGFHVSDTGIGIPDDAIDRIFAPFTQADASTTRTFGGTGLGLAICRELAERMGGGITVRSKLGAGSTFSCTVEADLAEPTRLDDPADRPLAGCRVLVVHEQPVIGESIERHLRTWGAEVTADPDGVTLVVLGVLDPVRGVAEAERLSVVTGGPVIAAAPLSVRPQLPESSAEIRAVVGTPVRRAKLREAVLGVLGRAAAPEPSRAELPVAERPLRILLAEDNPVNQRVAALMLERLGHRIDVVADGAEAVDAIAAEDYDLVLMDLHMPRLDGLAAAREARRRRPGDRPRIVAMTASATDESRRACLSTGMDDFIAKPVEVGDLARVVAETPSAAAS